MTLGRRVARLEARQPPPPPPLAPLSTEEREARIAAILARLPDTPPESGYATDTDAAWSAFMAELRAYRREWRR